MMDFYEQSESIEMFMKRTPNLKSLTIKREMNRDIIDASCWQHLITSSFPPLTILKFYFSGHCLSYEQDVFHDKFEKFQSEFWQEQHHWYTKYSSSSIAQIHTIPCISITTDAVYCREQSNNLYS